MSSKEVTKEGESFDETENDTKFNRQTSDASLYDDDDDPKASKNKIDVGPQVSLKDQVEKDKDDESLARWKEQLLGSVDLNNVGETLDPEVKILAVSILSPGRPDIVLPIPPVPNSKGAWFTLKEGSHYSLKFTFSVSNNIACGLRYTNAVWKSGIKVDSAKEMLGTFSPQAEPYVHEMSEETTPSDAANVGVNWGRVANDLPSATNVVKLLKSQGIASVKLYDTDRAVMYALRESGIKVVVTMPNEQLFYAATRPSFAYSWVLKNVAVHYPDVQVSAIAVGNEVFVDSNNLTKALVPGMANVHAALVRLKLDGPIKVSSPIALSSLANSYPPSAGMFREDLIDDVIKPMLELLRRTGSCLMLNVYPFFAYSANSDVISLDYALFRPNSGVLDPVNDKTYFSLFDAQMDAVYSAIKAVGFEDVKLVVSETGWPSKGDENEIGTGKVNAEVYNSNLIRRVLSGNAGTPLMPEAEFDVFLFALFNEDEKTGPTSERNYGLFYPTEEKVYNVDFHVSTTGVGDTSIVHETNRKTVSIPVVDSSDTNPTTTRTEMQPGLTWCVSNEAVGEERLQAALDYACGGGVAECEKIQPGRECYDPNTLVSHASFAFNDYYQKMGRAEGTCDFQGAAYVVSRYPVSGYGDKCEFSTMR